MYVDHESHSARGSGPVDLKALLARDPRLLRAVSLQEDGALEVWLLLSRTWNQFHIRPLVDGIDETTASAWIKAAMNDLAHGIDPSAIADGIVERAITSPPTLRAWAMTLLEDLRLPNPPFLSHDPWAAAAM